MAYTKLSLGSIDHISDRSIFFIPLENDHLDLKTLSTAPPAHRSVLQRNGLIAKICAGVTFYQAHLSATPLSSRLPLVQRSGESDAASSVELEALSAGLREELWRSALVSAGLLDDLGDKLVIPDAYAATPWPVHSDEEYTSLMEELSVRRACAAVNTSSFCAPVLSVDEYVYKHQGVRVCLGVAWMPRYTYNLRQWAATFARAGQRIPESSLLTLLHHVATGAQALRTAAAVADRGDCALSLSLRLEKVLVHRPPEAEKRLAKETEAHDVGGGGMIFVLAAGAYAWHAADAASPMKRIVVSAAEQQLYRTPEECTPRLYPTHGSATAKHDVWALGVILYLLASGAAAAGGNSRNGSNTSSPRDRIGRCVRAREVAPLNAAELTPDSMWRRLRRELESRGYGSTLAVVMAQLLSLDPLTRPSLGTLEALLQDLHRPTPVRRFPFALGSYDLLQMPNPTAIRLNPGARRYTMDGVYASGTSTRDKGEERILGVSSPSWADEELLPQLSGTDFHYMTFLYPLDDSLDERQRRRQVALALQCSNGISSMNASSTDGRDPCSSLDVEALFQIFGGFAVYKRVPELNAKGHVVYRVSVKEVLVPYPSHALRRSEMSMVKMTLDFTGGLPWPSSCTELMQKNNRVSRHVPFGFTGARHNVEWFGWVLPGERFSLPNGGDWTAPHDGAFVFWFDPDLKPTDRDRYYAVTSVRAATLPAKVSRTVLPDSLFRQHAGDDRHLSMVMASRVESGSPAESRQGRSSVLRNSVICRRSSHNATDVLVPSATHEIVEGDDEVRTVLVASPMSRPASQMHSAVEESNISQQRRRSSTKDRVPSRRTTAYLVAVVDAIDSAHGVRRSSGAARTPSVFRSASDVASSRTSATPQMYEPNSSIDRATPLRHFSAPCPPPLSPELVEGHTLVRLSERDATQPRPRSSRAVGESERVLGGSENTSPAAPQSLVLPNTKIRRSLVNIASSPKRPGSATKTGAESLPVSAGTPLPLVMGPPPPQTQSVPSPPNSGRNGTPRLLRLRPVSQRANAKDRGYATSPVATPRLPAIADAAPAGLDAMHIFGLWLPGAAVDATFRALTFCVVSTGEHGSMHPPVKLSPRVASAMRAPPGAAFVSFLSNELPLFHRNHPHLDVAIVSLLLPHHGFACYSADGTAVGLLSLRCSTKRDVDVGGGEFELDTHITSARRSTSVLLRSVYASYLTQCVADPVHVRQAAVRVQSAGRGDATDEKAPPGPLRHASSLPHRVSAGRSSVWANTPENQTLTLTSARHLDGDFTPHGNDDFAPMRAIDPPEVLPACWMGFDGATTALLFADAEQSFWVPYCIGG
ncbi:hypothetical protein NESM_000244000 [Novymonas esmeraldas]|uniref:Protein kinase domain-containing protein n=1 Tax=Novymonas esmeraldas TaxID=1808958 RepID=A0AAW0F693_9TRYP